MGRAFGPQDTGKEPDAAAPLPMTQPYRVETGELLGLNGLQSSYMLRERDPISINMMEQDPSIVLWPPYMHRHNPTHPSPHKPKDTAQMRRTP